MLGGGNFTAQNKILNGTYINFVSASKASATITDRGIATMPLELDWGVDNAVFEVSREDFFKDSLKMFGYSYSDEKMKGLRDLFMHSKTLYAYKLTSGGNKASNDFATAKYSGTRGNALKITISQNIDATEKFDVKVYMDAVLVHEQTGVVSAAGLVDNDFVTWKSDAELKVTAGTALTGGTNAQVDGNAHQAYLNKIESYSFHTMGVVSTDESVKSLYVAFAKRMRDEVGATIKFKMTIYRCTEIFDNILEEFKNTGLMPRFDIQVTNEDPAFSVGRSTKIYTNCIIDGDFIEQTICRTPKFLWGHVGGRFIDGNGKKPS